VRWTSIASDRATIELAFMKSLLDLYYLLLQRLLTVLLGLMIIPVCLQIISRHTGIIPRYVWTEEVARFCFVWMIMIGSMIAVRDGAHFDVDLLPEPETPQQAAILRLVVHLAMALMAGVFAWFGYKFARFGSIQHSEMSGINMLSIYVSFPMAGVTWLLFLGERIAFDVRVIISGKPGAQV